ncbi:hypothetical protein GCM10027088_47510 [Nocardia goodfellowii]
MISCALGGIGCTGPTVTPVLAGGPESHPATTADTATSSATPIDRIRLTMSQPPRLRFYDRFIPAWPRIHQCATDIQSPPPKPAPASPIPNTHPTRQRVARRHQGVSADSPPPTGQTPRPRTNFRT